MLPIIGVTGNIITINDLDYEYFNVNYSPQGFTQSILKAGGAPIIIPLGDKEYVKEYISMVDALILTGGEDVSPMLYGEEPRKVIGRTSPMRDEFEIALFKEAVHQKKPILGVCRGLQLINVVLGGTLYQDLSEDQSITIQHVQKTKSEFVTHSIQVKKNSILSNIMNSGDYVNSYHHQAINDLGNGLEVTAWSRDNVIEAIESVDKEQSIVGIQWHPELNALSNEQSLKIFQNLVERAELSKALR
ncbi:gamma-glutamyl-gamma-aminobutyrate hydrolase family protein [Fundicoccus culcitae]|uniref:Gamma-glutamyl-gamma-aminobutyrate hydrolase family protein n=1 Tax=Fundicoccus culcitae TaxID=2969821 RepID=A0ABY5P662_9LACT|nr:gamma-glutamyl-gamma-aminobutyrate hydrolase family protein [Fundicoccus culcitae]UUX34066.1 gamma-glutamyl-gamma-aminobutyrate hydrolase family protein [Fundicoccus culcitae]